MTSEETKATSGFKKLLFGTQPGWSGLILRLTLALVIYPHGAQKVLGLYGGYGWSPTMNFLTSLGIPTAVAALVPLIEFLAPFALVLGLLTRLAASGLIAVMIGAIMNVHLSNGFFMNWSNNPALKEGYEYHLLVIGMAFALVISGAGCFSIDRRIGGASKTT